MQQSKDTKNSGLFGAFLLRTLFPLLLMGILTIIIGSIGYYRGLTNGVKNELHSLAQSIATTYDLMHEGDYNLLVDDDAGKSYMAKGEEIISEDTSFIDDLSQKADIDISIFFYDMRMMTTLFDENGNRYVDTIAHTAVKEAVLVGKTETFYNRLTIGNDDYFVDYMPIFGADNTCIGMIATAKKSAQVEAYIMKMIINFILLTLIIMAVASIIVLIYIKDVSAAIDKIMKFLGEIAQGRLNTAIDEVVFSREDELGKMARFTVSVQGDLKKLIEKDALTGLYNRRSLKNKLEDMQKNCNSFCLALGDVDFFKRVNDTYGHDAGDSVLVMVATTMTEVLAGKGSAIRWGGEEFLILLPDKTLEESKEIIRALLDKIKSTEVISGDNNIKVTMTMGLMEGSFAADIDNSINQVDKLLYYGKEHGRDRLVTKKDVE